MGRTVFARNGAVDLHGRGCAVQKWSGRLVERSTFMVDRRGLYAELRSAYYIGLRHFAELRSAYYVIFYLKV
jgi:hypothetical protein